MTTAFETRAQPLRVRYDAYLAEHPKTRIRNVANALDVSEMELVAAGCGGIRSWLLASPAQDVFRELGSLGVVKALTRNDWCVHERNGRYEEIRAGKTMGIVVGPDIDLRMFFGDWKHTFAVDDGGRRSLQFFDRAGTAIHKVYLIEESDASAYETLVARHVDPAPSWPGIEPVRPAVRADAVDRPEDLRAQWLAMKDTHQFAQLLKQFNVHRLGALRGAGADLAQQVSNDAVEQMLQAVVDRDIAFMCFVGNHGLIQIHSGPIRKLLRTGPWFNVLEPHFNLHLDTTAIHQTWVVNKPTSEGWVTSLECYEQGGELIAQFFGTRKRGAPELASWRELMVEYCPIPLAA